MIQSEAYAPVMNRRIGEIAYDMSIKNGDEEVSRMHANGLCELIAEDTAMESSVQTDENENFIGVSGTRRVLDVLIDGKPLNPERMYTIATTSFFDRWR